jgi:hypothetical protein
MLQGEGPHPLSAVIADELQAVRTPAEFKAAAGTDRPFDEVLKDAAEKAVEEEAVKRTAAGVSDTRPTDQLDPIETEEAAERGRRRAVYRVAHRLDLSALCLSGGGIRSASISLGVIQALADKGLLRQFDYLSTVSGGGYIGSWLSAWLHHAKDADKVVEQLGEKRADPDREPAPLRHLRQYSNYLTPQVGIFTVDTWAAVAIVLRNLCVNWLLLLPVIALAVILVKLIATLLIGLSAEPFQDGLSLSALPVIGCLIHAGALAVASLDPGLSVETAKKIVAAVCLLAGCVALGYKLHRMYAPTAARESDISQRRFLAWSLLPAVGGGFCFVWLLIHQTTPADELVGSWAPFAPEQRTWGAVLLFAVAVFTGAIGVAAIDRKLSKRENSKLQHISVPVPDARSMFWNGMAWIAGVAVFATLVWAGVHYVGDVGEPVTVLKGLCVQSQTSCTTAPKVRWDVTIDRHLLVVIFGMPWFLLATMSAHTVYLLLRSASGRGDVEREWLGRASGWHLIAGLAWVVVSAIVMLGPNIYYSWQVIGANAGAWISALTAASGAVTAFLGSSGLTPAKGGASGWAGISSNIALAIAGPLFAALLLILISLLVDWSIAGNGNACFASGKEAAHCAALSWGKRAVLLVVLVLVVDLFANVNRFSIHALYRNRLVRAYLGGARAPKRTPDGFTDFDWNDNVRMASLWDRSRMIDREKNWRPFHVLNMTLNLAATRNLAWQQRKAASFTVTPFSCGNADLGYRLTCDYGGPVDDPSRSNDQRGITLGTAMAISGAAVSSNWGYHSSPSLAFLLTLFNLRLGWWLGNPGTAGTKIHWWQERDPYRQEGPQFALRPLVTELFGMTSDESPYVYLSDGGHFEDLGLYEMVRRRCRWIVISDDDQDGERGFEDLGNAVRKIWIDLGVRISFPDAPLLQADKEAKRADIPYFAIGHIHYVSDGDNPSQLTGKLLYIKPCVRGDEEAADIIAYQRSNPDFPAQSTGDQWFDESQLEAYRRLGYLMAHRMITAAAGWRDQVTFEQLFAGIEKLDPKTMRLRAPG